MDHDFRYDTVTSLKILKTKNKNRSEEESNLSATVFYSTRLLWKKFTATTPSVVLPIPNTKAHTAGMRNTIETVPPKNNMTGLQKGENERFFINAFILLNISLISSAALLVVELRISLCAKIPAKKQHIKRKPTVKIYPSVIVSSFLSTLRCS